MAAGAGVDLHTISRMYGIPYGTLARWASVERWPVTRPLSRAFKLRQLYDYDAVAAAVAKRQKRDASEQRAA